MHLFKSKNKDSHILKKPKAWKVTKDPATDWFIILCFGLILIIVVLITTGMEYYKTDNFIVALSLNTGVNADSNTKTKEEELQDIIKFYQEKEQKHEQLLGHSRVDSKVEQAKAAQETKELEAAKAAEAAKLEEQAKKEAEKAKADSQSSASQPVMPKPKAEPEELKLVIPGN